MKFPIGHRYLIDNINLKTWAAIISLNIVLSVFLVSNSYCSDDVEVIRYKSQSKEINISSVRVSIPALSPDGEMIAFVSLGSRGEPSLENPTSQPSSGHPWFMRLNGEKPTKLSDKVIEEWEPHISWTNNSKSVIYGSEGTIWITDLKSGYTRPINKPNTAKPKYSGYFEEYYHSPAVSPKGNMIAMRNLFDIWLYDMKKDFYKKIYSAPDELSPGTGLESNKLGSVVWSNNAEQIAFSSYKTVQLFKTTKWAEDISVIDINTGKVTPIVGRKENTEYHPVFSPDDRYVAFISRESWAMRPYVYVHDFKTNKSYKVSSCENECSMLSWSKKSDKLYYANYSAIWIINTKDIENIKAEKKILLKSIGDLRSIIWVPRHDNIYFLKKMENRLNTLGLIEINDL
jgi:Tol biopolymer transport system component